MDVRVKELIKIDGSASKIARKDISEDIQDSRNREDG